MQVNQQKSTSQTGVTCPGCGATSSPGAGKHQTPQRSGLHLPGCSNRLGHPCPQDASTARQHAHRMTSPARRTSKRRARSCRQAFSNPCGSKQVEVAIESADPPCQHSTEHPHQLATPHTSRAAESTASLLLPGWLWRGDPSPMAAASGRQLPLPLCSTMRTHLPLHRRCRPYSPRRHRSSGLAATSLPEVPTVTPSRCSRTCSHW
mmetsp:Transcript_34954/g.81072  ORF Transcript_34954/g.81072 Transcript_34954/m.81072 type:complete len:206 (+) Transcript_34954:132-749(+)